MKGGRRDWAEHFSKQRRVDVVVPPARKRGQPKPWRAVRSDRGAAVVLKLQMSVCTFIKQRERERNRRNGKRNRKRRKIRIFSRKKSFTI